MTLISATIPNLVNGVSQQPYSLRLSSQCEEQINGHSSVVGGLSKRPPTQHIAKISSVPFGNAFIHTINRDVTERYVVVATDGNLRVFAMDGTELPVAFPSGKSYLETSTPDRHFAAVTIADYTFVLNRNKVVTMEPTLTGTRPPETLVWVRQGAYGITYTVNIGGFVKSFKTPDGSEKVHAEQIATDYIAHSILNQFTADAAFVADFHIYAYGSTLHAHRKDGTDFLVETSDGLGDQAIKVCKDFVQRFTDLPARAVNGFRVEVRGDNSSSFDNYWVEYDNPTGGNATGVWKESVKGGEQYRLNSNTLPFALKRLEDGTFSFEPVEWDERKVGNAENIPPPSFVDRPVNDIFFHRNRLGLVADENVIFSRSGEFFNFWRSSATQLLDTDPIDVAVSHVKVSKIRHAIPFNETLLLFSDQTQFMLGASDILSPTSISINQTTEFQASLVAKPVGAGRNVYFAMNKGRFSGIREYYVDGETSTNDAADITAHVPHYIPGGVTKLAASSNEDILVALTPEAPDTLFVYKYFWQDLEKLQSAWSRWTLSPGSKILYVDFIESDLWVLVERNGEVSFELISLEAGKTDQGVDFTFHLDQRVGSGQCVVTYDEAADETRIELPYTVEDGSLFRVLGVGQGPYKMGQIIPVRWEGNVAVARGQFNLFLVGRTYEFRYRFSTLVVKEEAQGGGQMTVGAGRIQLRRMTLTFNNTGYFRAEVTPFRRDTYKAVFSGRVTGSGKNIIGEPALEDGRFRFPVSGRNEDITIEIVNDSPLPCALLSAEWEATFIMRSRRI